MGGWAVRRFVTTRAAETVSLDQSEVGAHLLEGAQREIEVILGMRGGKLAANARMSLWHNRISEASHENPFSEQKLAHVNRLGRFAEDHRHDRCLPGEWLEAEREQLLAEVAGVLMQLRHELRMAFDVPHRGEGARCHGRRQTIAE